MKGPISQLHRASRLPLSVRQFRGGGRRAGIIVVERTTALESSYFLFLTGTDTLRPL